MAQNEFPAFGFTTNNYDAPRLRPSPSSGVRQQRTSYSHDSRHPAMDDGFTRQPQSAIRNFDDFSVPGITFNYPGTAIDPALEGFSEETQQMRAPNRDLPPTLSNFLDDANSPWNPISQSRTSVNAPRQVQQTWRIGPRQVQQTWRIGPRSDSGNVRQMQYSMSDSAYASQTVATQSVKSAEAPEDVRESRELNLQTNNATASQSSRRPRQRSHATPIVLDGQLPIASVPQQNTQRYICTICQKVAKCPSDLKKHELRHTKPHRCNWPGCTRTEGFTTQNDLARHQKTTHKIGLVGGTTKSYRCVGVNCKQKDKIWPRFDNFKQHVRRMHPEQDQDDLIKRSEYHGVNHQTIGPNSLGVTPLETTVFGMDRTVPSPNAPMNIRITPEQATDNVDSFDFDQSYKDGMEDMTPSCQQRDSRSAVTNMSSQQPSTSNGPNTPTSSGSEKLSALAQAAAARQITRPLGTSRKRSHSGTLIDREKTHEPSSKSTDVLPQDLESSPGSDIDAALRSLTAVAGIGSYSQGTNPDQDDAKNLLRGFIKIAELISKKSERKSENADSRPRTTGKAIQCTKPGCPKVFSRQCEFKKHLKRHDRPYGCTYPRCHKIFGSKNDWKRHENSQHFQLEMWRCQVQPNGEDICGKPFWKQDNFKKHLKTEHNINEKAVFDSHLKEFKIGRNGQGKYWCGFCKKIITLTERGVAAWDERFNHIDDHFNGKKGRTKDDIQTWLCVETNKVKGEVKDEYNRQDQRSQGPNMAEEESSNDSDYSGSCSSETEKEEQLHPSKRPRANRSNTPKSHSPQEYTAVCCQCHDSLNYTLKGSNCISCSHPWCAKCVLEQV